MTDPEKAIMPQKVPQELADERRMEVTLGRLERMGGAASVHTVNVLIAKIRMYKESWPQWLGAMLDIADSFVNTRDAFVATQEMRGLTRRRRIRKHEDELKDVR